MSVRGTILLTRIVNLVTEPPDPRNRYHNVQSQQTLAHLPIRPDSCPAVASLPEREMADKCIHTHVAGLAVELPVAAPMHTGWPLWKRISFFQILPCATVDLRCDLVQSSTLALASADS